jgi:hypothetical protein
MPLDALIILTGLGIAGFVGGFRYELLHLFTVVDRPIVKSGMSEKN